MTGDRTTDWFRHSPLAFIYKVDNWTPTPSTDSASGSRGLMVWGVGGRRAVILCSKAPQPGPAPGPS